MIYETQEDRNKETIFLEKIKNHFKVEAMKLPYHWQIDVILHRNGRLKAFGELKCRTHTSTEFNSVIISEHKTKRAFVYRQHLGMDVPFGEDSTAPFIYFIRFLDCDMYTKIEPKEFDTWERKLLSAKNHMHDPLDTEYIRYVPISLFKKF